MELKKPDRRSFPVDLLICITKISKKVKKYMPAMFSAEMIHSIVDVLILNNISWESLNYLDFIDSLTIDKDFSLIIQIKILWMISYVLTRQFYKFQIDVETLNRRIVDFEYFQKRVMRRFRSSQIDEELICVCLSCLSKFQFVDFANQMGAFVKDTALVYLDEKSAKVRKETAKAVSLLNVRQRKSQSNSVESQKNDIFNKLLTIAISDPDKEVREIMLQSLNQNFHLFLKKTSNLKKLILSLSDTNINVQQKTIIILKSLIPSNSSLIIPAFQKVLFQLIKAINLKSANHLKGIFKHLKLLRCFIENVSFLMKNNLDLIFGFLLKSSETRTLPQT